MADSTQCTRKERERGRAVSTPTVTLYSFIDELNFETPPQYTVFSLRGLTSLSTHIHTHTQPPVRLFLQPHLLFRPCLACLSLYVLEVHSPLLRFDCVTSGWGLDRFADVLVTPYAFLTCDCAEELSQTVTIGPVRQIERLARCACSYSSILAVGIVFS